MGFQSMTTIVICAYQNHQETNDRKSVYFLFPLVKSGRLFKSRRRNIEDSLYAVLTML